METLKKEIEKLRFELKQVKEENSLLKEHIREREQQFFLDMYVYIEAIIHEYSRILNPTPVKIKASSNGKGELFEVSIKDVICIVSQGRKKHIYLDRPIENYLIGDCRETNVIIVNRDLTLDGLRTELDSLGYHLTQVDKGTVVNTKYYKLTQKGLELQLKKQPHKGLSKFSIVDIYRREYAEKKRTIDEIVSLHKLFVRYIGWASSR